VSGDAVQVDDRVLELLECFRQMTRAHLHRAGLNANPDHLGERLRLLERRKLIHCTRPGVNFGKVPYVYSLAASGAEYLASRWKSDRERLNYYRQAPTISASQFTHRSWCVTAHIEATKRWGDALLVWLPEYGAARSSTRAPTSLHLAHGRFVRPDALFAIDHGPKGRMAYALEVHNSTGAQMARLVDQIESHRQAQGLRLASKALSLGADYARKRDFVTLVLVPDDATRKNLWARLLQHESRESFVGSRNWFCCKTFGELDDGFSDWHAMPEAL
jgi:hypothetical protein